VIGISLILVLIVAVFARLNRDAILAVREAQENEAFVVRAGDNIFTVSMEDVESLSPADVSANYKTSGLAAETRLYQGVSLRLILEYLGIPLSDYTTAYFYAADGYASALTMEEAMDSDNCFIVISWDHQSLGTKENGGSGPFMMSLPRDRFSQRWCKFLLEIALR